MYRFLVVAIILAVAGLELTFPTTEVSARVRAMLPNVQLASMLTPQTADAREAETDRDTGELWPLRRVNDESPDDRLHQERFDNGL